MKHLMIFFLFCNFSLWATEKNIVFVAGKDSHRYGDHEFRAGCHLLAKKLRENNLPLKVTVIEENSWPDNNDLFSEADVIIIYSDGFNRHPLKTKNMFDYFLKLSERGVGLGFMHYACEVDKNNRDSMDDMIGGYYERLYSVNPHWVCDSILNRDHVCSNGVNNFSINDEWYFNMRLNDKIKPVLQGIPDTHARSGNTTYPRGALKHIVEAEGQKETLLWTLERPNGGRGFGFTGGHYHINWKDDDFRKLVLNTIVWTAGLDIPQSGIQSKTPTTDEMLANMKKQKPKKQKRK